MQIYLQKEAKKRQRTIQITVLFVMLCIILGSSVYINKNAQTYAHIPNKPLYTTTGTRNLSKNIRHYDEQVNTVEKMNNETELYSFSDEKTENYANDGIKISSDVRVLCNDGKTKVMDIEQYVLGCLLAEMPLGFEAQALMAQSVAIRSFTASKTQKTSSAHPDADVCTDYRCCQSYITTNEKNFDKNLLKKAEFAVNSTKGIIATYNSIPIEAVYHASSGYSTLSSCDVWGGNVPYLTSVDSPAGEAELTKKESVISYKKLSDALSSYSEKSVKCGNFGENLSIFNSENQLCSSISINGEEFSKSRIKSALALTSKDFKIEKSGENVKITCYGNGHRVGMSQHGANLLAKEGKGYAEILKYYYKGINLSFMSRDF